MLQRPLGLKFSGVRIGVSSPGASLQKEAVDEPVPTPLGPFSLLFSRDIWTSQLLLRPIIQELVSRLWVQDESASLEYMTIC